jgi:hypothetical protein
MQMFHLIQDDKRFLDSLINSDESTSHVSGKVNTHNCRIWSSENPRAFLERVRDIRKVNLFCTLSKERVYGPFFMETTITGIVYLDMLQQFLIPQLDEDDQEGHIPARRRTALLPWRNARVLQHPFPRSVDWQSGADSMTTSFPGFYTPGFFLMGIH